jgi:hypothetical protein
MTTLLRSPRSTATEKRRLIDPEAHLSWSVDVVSLVPEQIMNYNKGKSAIAGAILGKWACCAFPDGGVYAWQIKSSNFNESLEAPTEFVKYWFPDFATVDTNGNPLSGEIAAKPLMTLSPSRGDNESVHLYILHPITGIIVMIKISRRDLSTTSIAPIPNKVTTNITDDFELQDGERFDTLTCEGQLVVVGTSMGALYLIKYVPIPSGLHPQKIEATKSGILDRFFGKSTELPSPNDSSCGDRTPHVLPLSDTEFLSVSTASGVVQWTVEEKLAGGKFATFQFNIRLRSLADTLRSESWQLSKIVRATLTADQQAFHAIVEGEDQGEKRLFWVVFDLDGALIQAHWLSRFAEPDYVEVLGLVACENDTTYAAFAFNDTVVCMVLVDDDHVIHEVALPSRHAPGLFPGTMRRDLATHGCFVIAKTGLALRTRYLLSSSQSSKRPRLGPSGEKTNTSVSVQTLVSHLRDYFKDAYENQGIDRPLPPSLRQNDVNREQAVIQFAIELQHKGDASSYSNPLEWHRSFLDLIQDRGIFRCLSTEAKWSLFSVGQELQAFGVIADILLHKDKHKELGWAETLTPYNLGDWLLKIQVSEEESGWRNAATWHTILEKSLEAIWAFQEAMAGDAYDITSEYGRIAWISHPSMQKMLRRQLSAWKNPAAAVTPLAVEYLAKTGLRSFYGSWREEGSEKSKEDFAQVQNRAISLLRSWSNDMDEKAFDLCIEYKYFEGLCEIALSHERKMDAKHFSLDRLFDEIEGYDLLNGLNFSAYVLQWHAEKKLYGHVLNYGTKCISDLNLILEHNAELRQYKWVSATRQKQYEPATKSCLDNASTTKGIKNIEWNLNYAKLANKLVPSQNQQVLDRQQEIEKKLEIVEAQKILYEGLDSEILLPAVKLIETAIEKLNDATNIEKQVEVAVVALTLCTTLSDEAAMWENKVKIWTETLLLNGAQWSDWARGGFGNDLDYVRDEALNETVFGRLLSECRQDSNMSRVTYGRDMETEVIDRVQGDENRERFTRLLRAVAAPTESGSGESLMVSSF